MPRVAATAASAARSAPVRLPDPLSAHAVWIQTPKATTGRPARRAAAPPRAATASHSVNRPSRITGRRLAPGGAEQDVHPQPRRRVRRQELGGPLVGDERRPGVAHYRAEHLAAAG